MTGELQNIIFVGSFVKEAQDGTVGGQGFACQSLVASPISQKINWLLIDTTQKSQPPPSAPARLFYAGTRMLKLLRMLLFGKAQTVLVFSSFSTVSFSEKGLMLLIASLFGKRTVLAIRSEVKDSKHYSKTSWLRKRVLERCTNIVCQSQANTQALIKFDPTLANRVVTIPNWLNTDPFENLATKTPPQTINFMYMGWLVEHKGILDLVDAATQLIDNGHNFILHICGGGPLADNVDNVVSHAAYDNIKFHSWIYGADKIAMLDKNEVLILPSHTEGMSNAMLEAMAAGLGIIATRVGAATEVINSPDRGQLVSSGNIEELKAAMLFYIDNKQQVAINTKENKAYIQANHRLSAVLPDFAAVLNVEYRAEPDTCTHAK